MNNFLFEYDSGIFGKVSANIEESKKNSINETNNVKIDEKNTIALLEEIAIKYFKIAAIRNINFKRYTAPEFIDQ